MSGGTFLTWGGTSARQNNYKKIWRFGLATVTSQAWKYDVITWYELHYFRQNYTIMKAYR